MRILPVAFAALAALPLMLPAVFLPGIARADTALSAAEFDAYVTGKTLTYSQFGSVFGIEEYLPGRKVRWKTAPDECSYGHWYERGAYICFVYEYSTTEHCWTFWQEGDGLRALSEGADPANELAEVAQTTDGLQCPAPDVGV